MPQIYGNPAIRSRLFLLFRLSATTVFLGRAWQHLFWDAPLRTFFWDEQLMSGFVRRVLGRSWQEYVTDPAVDMFLSDLVVVLGLLYLVCAFIAWFLPRLPRWTGHVLWLGILGLTLLAVCYWKEKFFHWGQLLEYALQVGSPVFLWVWYYRRPSLRSLFFWMRVATALTFICHGLYAMAYYPRPELFTSMTMSILGVGEGAANQILVLAGYLDFAAAALLFLPGRWALPGIIYCILWGFATAFARIWAHIYWDFLGEVLHQWVHATVYRLPHGLIPLALLVIWREFRRVRATPD